MRLALTMAALVAATPALAHHEVVVATSLMPLAGGVAAITLAGLAVWRDRWKMRKKRFRRGGAA